MSTQSKSVSRSRILRTLLLVVIALIVGFGIYQWNASTLAGNSLPMPFGFGVAVVVSGSMEPTLSINDMIVVRPAEGYAVGDVVVFQAPSSSLVVHRIISVDGDTVITQGDANNAADAPISVRDIKGKVAFSIPFVGMIVDAIKSLPGTLLLLFLAGWLYYKSIQREKTADQEQLDSIRAEIERLKAQNTETGEDTKDTDKPIDP